MLAKNRRQIQWGRNLIIRNIGKAAALAALGAELYAAPAIALEKVNVAIGQRGLWDTLSTVFAQENGYFKELGLDIHHIKTRGGAETARVVMTGDMNFGMDIGVLGALNWMYGPDKDEATKRFAKMNKLPLERTKKAVSFYKRSYNRLTPIGNLDEAIRLAVQYKRIKKPLTAAQKAELVHIVFDPNK